MWDKMVQNDVMRRDAPTCGMGSPPAPATGAGGLPMPQVLPREFFLQI